MTLGFVVSFSSLTVNKALTASEAADREWQALQLSTASAKLLIYQAFIEDELGFPKHLARRVHELYFQPVHEEFQARTMCSLSNAFTGALKELEPIPQYKATEKLAGFLQSVRPQ